MPVPCILPDNASPSPKPRRERPTLASGLLCAGILCLSFTAHAADDNKAQLKSIQQDIANKEKSVRSQKIQRSNLLDQLQSQEKSLLRPAGNYVRRKPRLKVLTAISRPLPDQSHNWNNARPGKKVFLHNSWTQHFARDNTVVLNCCSVVKLVSEMTGY